MSSTFKILHSENQKKVLSSGELEKFMKYDDLKKHIVSEIKNDKNLDKSLRINEKDQYVLNIKEEKIGALTQIWDEGSFQYLKNKLRVSETKKITFILQKVKEMPPEFQKPSNKEIALKIIEIELESSKKKIEDSLNRAILEESSDNFEERRKVYNDSLASSVVHKKIVCNRCLEANFKGKRYMCSYCNNYNLCGKCESELNQFQFHSRDHLFLLFNKAIEDIDILEYKNAIIPKEIIIQTGEDEYEMKFRVVNCGAQNLNNCFIAPIKFGNKFLSCEKKTVEDFEPKTMQDIEFKVKLPVEHEVGTYKGYFRMFTEKGLPFGEIIYVNYSYIE